VAIIQRFGGALNLNVHIHALVMDGVFVDDAHDVRFCPAGRLTRDDVADVVAVVARRIERMLERRGVAASSEAVDATDAWTDDAPVLAGLAAASVQGRIALGSRAGARAERSGEPLEEFAPVPLGRSHAQAQGYDLHAAIRVPAGQRERLERLCRYALRPPVAEDLLRLIAKRKGLRVQSSAVIHR
jgi:putative transposase